MSGNTPETVWYENTEHGTLHEVEKGSATERRLRREQREVYEKDEDGQPTGDPDYEPAYRKLNAGEVKKAQENPEKVPGYPALRETARLEKAAAKERQAARDEALDAAIAGNGSQGDGSQAGK